MVLALNGFLVWCSGRTAILQCIFRVIKGKPNHTNIQDRMYRGSLAEEGGEQWEWQITKAASGECYKWWKQTLTPGKQLDIRTDTKTAGLSLTESSGQSGSLAGGWWECNSGGVSACSAGAPGDVDPVPALGRSPGGGHGNSLQYSCLENLMDRGAWQAIVHRVPKSCLWRNLACMHPAVSTRSM